MANEGGARGGGLCRSQTGGEPAGCRVSALSKARFRVRAAPFCAPADLQSVYRPAHGRHGRRWPGMGGGRACVHITRVHSMPPRPRLHILCAARPQPLSFSGTSRVCTYKGQCLWNSGARPAQRAPRRRAKKNPGAKWYRERAQTRAKSQQDKRRRRARPQRRQLRPKAAARRRLRARDRVLLTRRR